MFFEQVAAETNVKHGSAKGTFYGFMRADQSLPKSHKEAYVRLVGITPELVEEIEALRERPPADPDLMADLQAQVNELAQRVGKVDELEHEVRRVDHRVSRLEDRLT